MKRFDVSLVFLALYIHTSILCAEAMLGGSGLVTEEGDILLSWRRILLWFLFVLAILNGDRLQTATKQDEESGAARATRSCLLADCGGVLTTPDLAWQVLLDRRRKLAVMSRCTDMAHTDIHNEQVPDKNGANAEAHLNRETFNRYTRYGSRRLSARDGPCVAPAISVNWYRSTHRLLASTMLPSLCDIKGIRIQIL